MSSTPGWDRQTLPEKGKPHGWVQWKGTGVCMDLHCVCGEMSHLDADFAYYVQCPACDRVYMSNGHVEMVELTAEEIETFKDRHGSIKRASTE